MHESVHANLLRRPTAAPLAARVTATADARAPSSQGCVGPRGAAHLPWPLVHGLWAGAAGAGTPVQSTCPSLRTAPAARAPEGAPRARAARRVPTGGGRPATSGRRGDDQLMGGVAPAYQGRGDGGAKKARAGAAASALGLCSAGVMTRAGVGSKHGGEQGSSAGSTWLRARRATARCIRCPAWQRGKQGITGARTPGGSEDRRGIVLGAPCTRGRGRQRVQRASAARPALGAAAGGKRGTGSGSAV